MEAGDTSRRCRARTGGVGRRLGSRPRRSSRLSLLRSDGGMRSVALSAQLEPLSLGEALELLRLIAEQPSVAERTSSAPELCSPLLAR
jgi:hypothetical protein